MKCGGGTGEGGAYTDKTTLSREKADMGRGIKKKRGEEKESNFNRDRKRREESGASNWTKWSDTRLRRRCTQSWSSMTEGQQNLCRRG